MLFIGGGLRAGVRLFDGDERRANQHGIAGLRVEDAHRASIGRRNIYQRFGGLDLADRLVEVDDIAHLHKP